MAGLVDDWPDVAGGLARKDDTDSEQGDGLCPNATLLGRISSEPTMAATEVKERLVIKRRGHAGDV